MRANSTYLKVWYAPGPEAVVVVAVRGVELVWPQSGEVHLHAHVVVVQVVLLVVVEPLVETWKQRERERESRESRRKGWFLMVLTFS